MGSGSRPIRIRSCLAGCTRVANWCHDGLVTKQAAPKWQYFSAVFIVYSTEDVQQMNITLNEWGQDGWEAVSLSRPDRIAHVLLKRIVSSEVI